MPSSFSGRPFPAFTPAQRWHLDVYGFVVVPCTLTPAECGRLRQAVLGVRRELLGAPREMDQTVRADARGPGPGGCFIRPADTRAPLHLLAHLIEADPAITAYACHPKLVAMCEEYIGGEARIVESNCFVNSGNPGCRNAAEDGDGDDAEQRFSPSWHRGTDLPYANHVGRASGLTHCNFVKALTNLTELRDEADGGTVLIKGSHKLDVPTEELAAVAAAHPEMVHTVVAPAGSTLVFGETTIHATGRNSRGRQRIVLSTGYGASHFPYWHDDHTHSAGGYRPMSEAFLASVPREFATLIKGKQSWGRGQKHRQALTDPADARTQDCRLGDALWVPPPYRAAL